MLFRCILIVVLTTNPVFTKTDDDITAEWLMKRLSNNTNQDKQDGFNLDPTVDTQTFYNINEEQKQKTNATDKGKEDNFNLDPNLGILNLDTPSSSSVRPTTAINNTEEVSESEISLVPSLPDVPQECLTKENERGACVLYFQCDPDYRVIIDDGNTLIDLRSQERSCRHYLEVCCLTSKVITVSKETFVDKNQNIDVQNMDVMGSDAGTCGWSNPALNFFQIKSKEIDDNRIYANYGEFPWMIALIKNGNTDKWSRNDYLGGGSLIRPDVVITAAHKVDQLAAREIKCRAGEWDTQTTFELFEHQERMVSKKIIHPDFFKTSVYNDIAILFLKSPFDLTQSPNIGLACVGTTLPPPGIECFSMGWGKEFKEKDKYAVILKKVKLPLVGAENCQELLRKTRLGPFFELHKSLTCAGGEKDVDTCRGDGGSSLVCPIQTMGANTKYAVFGMVAYGIGCGKVNRPSVYVNIPHLKPWLDDTLAKEGQLYTELRSSK